MRNSMFFMDGLKFNNQRLFSLKLAKNLIIWLIIVFLFDFFLFPMPTLANEAVANADNNEAEAPVVDVFYEIKEFSPIVHLPQNNDKSVKKTGKHVITAYNSEKGQTDNSPCITANGFNLCEHGIEDSVAANFLPFGAKIKMPELFGDKVFVVRDRMNARHAARVDIWMKNKIDAKKFGVKLAKIEVLE